MVNTVTPDPTEVTKPETGSTLTGAPVDRSETHAELKDGTASKLNSIERVDTLADGAAALVYAFEYQVKGGWTEGAYVNPTNSPYMREKFLKDMGVQDWSVERKAAFADFLSNKEAKYQDLLQSPLFKDLPRSPESYELTNMVHALHGFGNKNHEGVYIDLLKSKVEVDAFTKAYQHLYGKDPKTLVAEVPGMTTEVGVGSEPDTARLDILRKTVVGMPEDTLATSKTASATKKTPTTGPADGSTSPTPSEISPSTKKLFKLSGVELDKKGDEARAAAAKHDAAVNLEAQKKAAELHDKEVAAKATAEAQSKINEAIKAKDAEIQRLKSAVDTTTGKDSTSLIVEPPLKFPGNISLPGLNGAPILSTGLKLPDSPLVFKPDDTATDTAKPVVPVVPTPVIPAPVDARVLASTPAGVPPLPAAVPTPHIMSVDEAIRAVALDPKSTPRQRQDDIQSIYAGVQPPVTDRDPKNIAAHQDFRKRIGQVLAQISDADLGNIPDQDLIKIYQGQTGFDKLGGDGMQLSQNDKFQDRLRVLLHERAVVAAAKLLSSGDLHDAEFKSKFEAIRKDYVIKDKDKLIGEASNAVNQVNATSEHPLSPDLLDQNVRRNIGLLMPVRHVKGHRVPAGAPAN